MANDMISSTTSSRDLSNERKKNGTRHWKEETEGIFSFLTFFLNFIFPAEKIERLGTIYTANDYVSTIDMGTERPWPFGGIFFFNFNPEFSIYLKLCELLFVFLNFI